jgi:DNA-binding protein YbaB
VRTPLPPLHDTLAGRLTEATRDQPPDRAGGMMRALHDLISETTAAIDDVTAQIRDQMTRAYAGTSGSGRVRPILLGNGTLQRLELDRTWAEQAHATNVGRECLQAIQDAYRRLGEDDAGIVERSPIGRMRRLTQDPVALAREVGLRD